jgi:hypothetical protein
MGTTPSDEEYAQENTQEPQGIAGWLIRNRFAADTVQANRTLVVIVVVLFIFIVWLNWPSDNRQNDNVPLGPPQARSLPAQ